MGREIQEGEEEEACREEGGGALESMIVEEAETESEAMAQLLESQKPDNVVDEKQLVIVIIIDLRLVENKCLRVCLWWRWFLCEHSETIPPLVLGFSIRIVLTWRTQRWSWCSDWIGFCLFANWDKSLYRFLLEV